MDGLSERKTEIVRTLVEASPDKVVGALQAALAGAGSDGALGEVRRLVDAEAADRRLRNAVLQPIAPMFAGDGRDPTRLVFPLRALGLLWAGLKQDAPLEVARAAAVLRDLTPEDEPPKLFDELAASAAAGIRLRSAGPYAAAAELCDQARPEGAELLGACIDLAPVVRRATLKLGEWITRITDLNAAGARLAYRDAVAIADDAGPRFFEMLAAQLAQPWNVLRIVSAVMDRPSESYLAQTELAGFALRLMDEIDRGLAAVSRLDVDGGPPAGRAAAKVVETLTQQITELEESIELGREAPWGLRLARQRKALAGAVEERLRAAEKAVAQALPTQVVRIAGKITKDVPRLQVGPDAKQVGRAVTLLTFAQEVRSSIQHGGFGATRAKVLESISESLDHYVEEVLDRLRHHEAPDPQIAAELLNAAARITRLVHDPRAAEVIRRRTAAALAEPSPTQPPAS